jgi:hypothetical protein
MTMVSLGAWLLFGHCSRSRLSVVGRQIVARVCVIRGGLEMLHLYEQFFIFKVSKLTTIQTHIVAERQ